VQVPAPESKGRPSRVAIPAWRQRSDRSLRDLEPITDYDSILPTFRRIASLNLLDGLCRPFSRLLTQTVRVNSSVQSSPALTLVDNWYDNGDVPSPDPAFTAGAAAGKLTRQRSYRLAAGTSSLVSTRKLVYGTSSASTCTTPTDDPAYTGLNGRLASTIVSIAPWGKELVTEYCYGKLGQTAAVQYPNFTPSRTEAGIEFSYQDGFLVRVKDKTRNKLHLLSPTYTPVSSSPKCFPGLSRKSVDEFLPSGRGSANPSATAHRRASVWPA
jgi:hypothetical protein